MAKSKQRFRAKSQTTVMTNGTGRRVKLPKQEQLPGTEQVRDKVLDAYCHGLSECRETTAQALADEKGYKVNALRHMIDRKIASYTAAGIRLDKLKGADKLAVHVAKDQASATASGTPTELAEGDEPELEG